MAPEAVDLPSDKPLAAARARLEEAARPPKPPKPAPVVKEKIVYIEKPPPEPPKSRAKVDPHLVVGLNAAGVTQTRIAKALGVSHTAVEGALDRLEGSREQIKSLRETLRLDTLKRAHKSHDAIWNRLDRELVKGSAKDVDAMARAAGAVEKIAASASGEGLKVEHTGLPPASNTDLKVLIQQFLA